MTTDVVITEPADPLALIPIIRQPPQKQLDAANDLLPLIVSQEPEQRLELEPTPSEDAAEIAVALGGERERRRPLVQTATALHHPVSYKAVN